MEIGDLCWARDTDGIYYLAEVTGDWDYRDDEDHRAVDIHHVRPCTWYEIGTAERVPAGLIEAFRGQALRRFAPGKPSALWFTHSLHALRTEAPEPSRPDDGSVWGLMSADDMEDLVASYLQHQGYVLIPSTAKRSTPGYEYSLVSPNGRTSIVQVKKGRLSLEKFEEYDEDVIVFARKGYRGTEGNGTRALERGTLEAFMEENPDLLPPRVQYCWKVLEDS
jgi:hypothetical protein